MSLELLRLEIIWLSSKKKNSKILKTNTLTSLDSSLPQVPPEIKDGITSMTPSLPDFALGLQQELRRLDDNESRFSAMEKIVQENISLKANTIAFKKKTIREQHDLIRSFKSSAHRLPLSSPK